MSSESPESQLSLFGETTALPVELPANNFELIPTSSNIPIPPGTYSSLSQLATHCQVCHRCELGDTRINAVVGRGSETAPILIIGEGPGQNEDEQGLPFVGRTLAGKAITTLEGLGSTGKPAKLQQAFIDEHA